MVSVSVFPQIKTNSQLTASLWDGMAVAGYLDRGAFLNFGGPGIKWVRKPVCVILGMLPSLRFKQDPSGTSKNSFVTPTLGAGISIAYKHIVFQVPVYYTPKTTTANGKWNPGAGVGFKF